MSIDIGIRVAAPEGKSLSERLSCLVRVLVERCHCYGILESQSIDCDTMDCEHVSVPSSFNGVAAQAAEIRDERLD